MQSRLSKRTRDELALLVNMLFASTLVYSLAKILKETSPDGNSKS